MVMILGGYISGLSVWTSIPTLGRPRNKLQPRFPRMWWLWLLSLVFPSIQRVTRELTEFSYHDGCELSSTAFGSTPKIPNLRWSRTILISQIELSSIAEFIVSWFYFKLSWENGCCKVEPQTGTIYGLSGRR